MWTSAREVDVAERVGDGEEREGAELRVERVPRDVDVAGQLQHPLRHHVDPPVAPHVRPALIPALEVTPLLDPGFSFVYFCFVIKF